MEKIAKKIKDNRKLIIFCLVAAILWGLAAHAYAFFHSSFSHDSLNEFNAELYGHVIRIIYGRIFVPAYRILVRGVIALPWLIGMLSMLYIGAAVFFTVKTFDIRSNFLIALTAGVFTANVTVTAGAATYIHDLDCDMLALALVACAVFLWKQYRRGFLIGMPLIGIALGLYQSYISVAITLILLYLIMKLLDGKDFHFVFFKGLKSVAMLLGGGVVYLISLRVTTAITGYQLVTDQATGVFHILSMPPGEILSSIVQEYIDTIKLILYPAAMYPARVKYVTIFMVVLAGIFILIRIFSRQIHVKEKILSLVLIALIPLGMNITQILTGGMSHDLMHFALWLTYLFVLLIAWWQVKKINWMALGARQGVRAVLVVCVGFLLFSNVQTSNAAYVKKDLEAEANLSFFTRLLYRIESYDGYVPGETPVVIMGMPENVMDYIPGFENIYNNMVGSDSWYINPMQERVYYWAYFKYVLASDTLLADQKIWDTYPYTWAAGQLTAYPDEGCMNMIQDVLVVNLGGDKRQ